MPRDVWGAYRTLGCSAAGCEESQRSRWGPGLLIYRYASSGGEPELIKTGTYTTLGGIYHFCNRKELGVTVNKSEASFCENIEHAASSCSTRGGTTSRGRAWRCRSRQRRWRPWWWRPRPRTPGQQAWPRRHRRPRRSSKHHRTAWSAANGGAGGGAGRADGRDYQTEIQSARRRRSGHARRPGIVEEWRLRSSRGRYEHAMWKAAGLEEPCGRWQQKEGGATWAGEDDGARAFEGDEAMDNLRAHPQWQI